MNITLLVTGKCKEKPILELETKYLKLLSAYAKTQVVELPQSKAQRAEEIKAQEAAQQLAKISPAATVVALDERGEQLSTRKLAQKIQTLRDAGAQEWVFVIGGAEGLDKGIRNRANLVLGLSQLTFPHMMVRPIVLEQLFRCLSLNAGHPYHRD